VNPLSQVVKGREERRDRKQKRRDTLSHIETEPQHKYPVKESQRRR